MTRDEQIDQGAAALCRFVFPGFLVPRRAMAEAVIAAAADETPDWLEHLPPKRIVAAVAEPVEITDELLDRAWHAGQADLPDAQRVARQWDKPALRAALRAALRVITERAPAL